MSSGQKSDENRAEAKRAGCIENRGRQFYAFDRPTARDFAE